MKNRVLYLLVSVAALIILSSCGGSDDPVGPTGGTPTGTTVDSTGGAFTFASGAVTMVFPAGAVDSAISVTVTASSTYPADTGYIPQTCYAFTPDGQVFDSAVTLHISYDDANLPAGMNETSLKLCKVVGDTWQPVPGYAVDINSNIATAPITGFSSYGLVGTVISGGGTYQGDYYITDSTSLANFMDYGSIAGKLEIRSDAPDSVVLPNLLTITGTLDLYGPGAITHNLKHVSIPNLTSIANSLLIRNCDSLQSINLPMCNSAGSIVIQYNSTLRDFDGLSNISSLNPSHTQYLGSLEVRDNDSLQTLNGFAGLGGEATGSITITENPSLISVAGLAGISSTWGSFEISYCRNLTSIAGLGLTSCGVDLTIRENHFLTSLTGLEHLHTVSRILDIDNNPLLEDLTGLSSVTHVGNFIIKENDGIRSLDGLGSVTDFTIAMMLDDCPRLADISALDNLTTVASHVRIQNCDSLETLAGLESLSEIGGSLILIRLTHLRNLDALSSLNHIQGGLYISDNYLLSSITGIHGLQQNAGTGFVLEYATITENAMAGGGGSGSGLTDAAAWAFITAIGGEAEVEGEIIIEGNG